MAVNNAEFRVRATLFDPKPRRPKRPISGICKRHDLAAEYGGSESGVTVPCRPRALRKVLAVSASLSRLVELVAGTANRQVPSRPIARDKARNKRLALEQPTAYGHATLTGSADTA